MSRLSTDQVNARVGQRLIAIRNELQMTQSDLAASISISQRAYANYERGEREIPMTLVQNLYRIHQIDPIWLLEGKEPEPIRATSRILDDELLEQVIALVLSGLRQARKTLPPDRLARVIRLAYLACAREGVDRSRVSSRVGELLQAAA